MCSSASHDGLLGGIVKMMPETSRQRKEIKNKEQKYHSLFDCAQDFAF